MGRPRPARLSPPLCIGGRIEDFSSGAQGCSATGYSPAKSRLAFAREMVIEIAPSGVLGVWLGPADPEQHNPDPSSLLQELQATDRANRQAMA
jgi:hypothetical protein